MQWEDAYDTAGDIFIIRYLFTRMMVLIFHVSLTQNCCLTQNLTRGNMQKMSDDLELILRILHSSKKNL